MCLATAEVLLKQSGDSSLDKARDSHRHHGLIFTNRTTSKNKDEGTIHSAANLVAQPATRIKDERYGTFELWHKSARAYPTPAQAVHIDRATGSQVESVRAVGVGRDVRFPLVPESGITLAEALGNIPGMWPLVAQFGGVSNLVRAHVNVVVDKTFKLQTLSIIVHPGDKTKIDAFFAKCMFDANDIERIEFTELESGGIINIRMTEAYPHVSFSIPSNTSDKFPTVFFFADGEEYMNEFGFLYVALYIVGNYARYYPDFWIRDVEKNTQLGLLVEHLLNVAEQRIGLLALSEMSQVFYIPA